MSSSRPPDPVRLVWPSPAITEGEDWRERSRISWIILATREGHTVAATDDGSSGDPKTWCGNVCVGDSIYQVHRGTSRAVQMGVQANEDLTSMSPVFYVSIWAEPDPTSNVFQPD